MKDKELMSKEAFIELIDNLEIVKELSSYGVKNIKYYFKKLQEENEKYKYLYQKALDNTIISDRENIRLKKQIDLMAKYIAKEKSDKFCDVKYICDQNCESCIIQYFSDEVGE